jgi:PAS domain S-box-containing protein
VSRFLEEALVGDEDRTREELINELEELRRQVSRLKGTEEERRSTEAPQSRERETENAERAAELSSSFLVDGKYTIHDLVDIDKLRVVFEQFSEATGFTTGFVDYPGQEILIATGWRDICTKFHRSFSESAKHCKESNIQLTKQLIDLKELNINPCKNGLVDGATPVVVKGKHIASLATGQVLFGEPDLDRFRKQAETYNFDVDEYLDALSRVPVVSENEFRKVLSFLSQLAVLMAEMGLNRLQLKERTVALEKQIAERKKAEEALRAGEKLYQSIMDASLVGIYVAQDMAFRYVNREMARMFGYTVEELENELGPTDMVVPEEREMLRRSLDQRYLGEPYGSYEFKGLRKDGSTFDGMVWPTPILYKGEPAAAGTCVDITKSKSLENQLRQAQKMEAVGILAGGVAHDFNNLLQVVLGYADMLLIDLDREHPHHKGLATIREAARDGAELVKSLLTFSRKVEIRPRSIDLNREVKRVRELLYRTIPKMVGIELVLEEELKTIHADPAQMEQVLLNLAVNASDAMPEGGQLTIETKNVEIGEDYGRSHFEVEPGEYVLLTVSDTGHGMEKEVLEHIFEPFYTTKQPGKGTGLGLATAFGIVKSHKGYVTCCSEPGTGAAFNIYLPVMRSDAKSDAIITTETAAFGTETILLVDDEKRILDLGKDILSLGGYRIITATNGQEALEIFREKRADVSLVVLDLIMPRMGGRECLEGLLNIDPTVKVILASGYSTNGPSNDAVASGACGFISKPYDAKQILHLVRNVLDQK